VKTRILLAVLLLELGSILMACSSAAAQADADAFSGTARTMAMVERRCTEPQVDAGRCDPSVIRGLTRSARCLVEPRLEARSLPTPDGGTPCSAEAQ
jgi:hypothetical protein